MADKSLKVLYFNGKGRAEFIRLLLAAAGKDFDDVRMEGEEWAKKKPSTPFGQMPLLEVDGKLYGQSMAIATYLAKELGVYGKTNLDGLVIDQVLQLIQDLINIAVKFFFEKDETKKAELEKSFLETDCPKFFGFFENMLKESGTGYFVGESWTLADIAVYDISNGMLKEKLCSMDDFPLLKALVDKIGAMDKVKAWVDKRPVTQF